jgi:hypothetical protein
MRRCEECGSDLIYTYDEHTETDSTTHLLVAGDHDGARIMVNVRGQWLTLERACAGRLRAELEHWLESTVDYGVREDDGGELVSTGKPRDLEMVQ